MKKTAKKCISLVLIFAILLSYFTPILNAIAQTSTLRISYRDGSVGNGKVQYSIDGGTIWNDVLENDEPDISGLGDNNLKLRVIPNEGYYVDYSGMELELDETKYNDISNFGLYSPEGYTVPKSYGDVRLNFVEFRSNNGPDTPGPTFDSTAHVNVTVLGSEIENPYGPDASEIRVSVNSDFFNALDPNHVSYSYETINNEQVINKVVTTEPMEIGYQDINENTVVIGIRAQWNTFLTDVTVNGVSYANQLPKNKDDLIAVYNNQEIRVYLEVPKDPDNNYNVQVEGRKQNDSEIIMGNFLWDYNEQGYTGPDDKILHSNLVFIKAEYNNQVYTTVDAVNNVGNLFHWRDALRKDSYSNDWEGVGEATFPVGTLLTVAIIPDAGYQLVSFGVNEGGFEPQDEIGVYTFEIQGGNFHLQAHVTDVDNEVNADLSESIENGRIAFGGNEEAMAIGTARLDIEDRNNLPQSQVEDFNTASNDYEIQNIFDVSLFNTVFKGSQDASWDTPVSQLNNNATITLNMAENMNGKDIVIIHEKHNGNDYDYEIINPVYNEENNTITFQTDSFSNYAIATKQLSDTTKYTVHFETNGGKEIADKKVTVGNSVAEPEPPFIDGLTFDGWYEDATFTTKFDFNTPITNDVTLYAKWVDNRDTVYSVSDENGNKITFKEEEGHTYQFVVVDYLSLSDEDLQAANISKEEYNSILQSLKGITKIYGDLIGFIGIEVSNENNQLVHAGPFNIKIKMTDEMKKYNTFKIIYVDVDNNLQTEDPIELKQEGDYLVGTLPHLSAYALTGSITSTVNESVVSNPQTGDNIYSSVGILIVSIVGLAFCTITATKKIRVK